jgi:hypothetical protein
MRRHRLHPEEMPEVTRGLLLRMQEFLRERTDLQAEWGAYRRRAMVRARMWTADKRMPLGVPRVGEVLKGGRMKNKTEKENPQHKRFQPLNSVKG